MAELFKALDELSAMADRGASLEAIVEKIGALAPLQIQAENEWDAQCYGENL